MEGLKTRGRAGEIESAAANAGREVDALLAYDVGKAVGAVVEEDVGGIGICESESSEEKERREEV